MSNNRRFIIENFIDVIVVTTILFVICMAIKKIYNILDSYFLNK
jgi:hypothetical protein